MTVLSYRAGRVLKIGEGYRQPGEPLPEGVTWFRIDNYVHTGYVDEVQVEPEELLAWIEQYCPQLKQQVAELSGLPDDIDLTGPHRTPRRRPAKK